MKTFTSEKFDSEEKKMKRKEGVRKDGGARHKMEGKKQPGMKKTTGNGMLIPLV